MAVYYLLSNIYRDEELLREGLALNDELQQILARHDAVLSGTAAHAEKPKTLQALVDIDDSAATNADNSAHKNQRFNTSTSTGDQSPFQQLLLPAPPAPTSLAKVDPNMDLLSGEDFSKPTTESHLALVPATDLVDSSASSRTEQNMLALSNRFSQNNNNSKEPTNAIDSNMVRPASQTYPAASQLQLQPQQSTYYSNQTLPNSGVTEYEQAAYIQGTRWSQANPAWNGQSVHGLSSQQQAPYCGSLPPPPWEGQPVQNNQLVEPHQMQSGQPGGGIHPHPTQSSHLGGMHPIWIQKNMQMGMLTLPMQSNQVGGLYSQPLQGGQFAGMQQQPLQGVQLMGYGYGQQPEAQNYDQRAQLIGYGYGRQPEAQYYDQRAPYPYASPDQISQRMYGLSLKDFNYMNMTSSYQIPTSSTSYSQQSNRPFKPEDKLFGDLVNLAKPKQNKPNGNKMGSL